MTTLRDSSVPECWSSSPLQQVKRGVVLIDYSFAMSLFAKKFDVARIAERYHFVLEPSWSGYCDLDILCYCKFSFPVFGPALGASRCSFASRLGLQPYSFAHRGQLVGGPPGFQAVTRISQGC